MKQLGIVAAVAAMLVWVVPHAWADGTTSPGKTAVYVSQSGVSVPLDFPGTLVSGTIAKGKKKHVLEVDLTLTDQSDVAHGIAFRARVNNVEMEPTGPASQLYECTPSFFNCTASGHFWLDLDAAETANPGVFINQPLIVDMQGAGDVAFTGAASLRAHLQKK